MSLLGSRGRRECRVRSAPAAACAKKSTRVSNHRYAAINRHSLRDGLRLMSRSPRGPGSFAPVAPADRVRKNLTPASGRQDHTPSPSASAPLVLRRSSVHRIPPHVRDDREAPLLPRRDGADNTQFTIFRNANFCTRRTDNANQLESAHEIKFFAPKGVRSQRHRAKFKLSRPTSGKSVPQADWSRPVRRSSKSEGGRRDPPLCETSSAYRRRKKSLQYPAVHRAPARFQADHSSNDKTRSGE
jgi:hypothetical protein